MIFLSAETDISVYELTLGEAYTRNGRFELSADGRIVTAEGFALQDASGGDIFLQSEITYMLPDGTLLEEGLPVARIGIFSFGESLPVRQESGVFLNAPDGVSPVQSESVVRQGVYENSNVSVPAEMIEMMRAVKQAESGARLAQAYDGLLGQAITTFGQRR